MSQFYVASMTSMIKGYHKCGDVDSTCELW